MSKIQIFDRSLTVILIVKKLIPVLRVCLVMVLLITTLSSYYSSNSAHLIEISVLMTVYPLILLHRDLVSWRCSNNVWSCGLRRATQLLLMHAYFATYRTWLVWLGLRVLSHPLLKAWPWENSAVIIILICVLWICRKIPCILILKLVLDLVLAPLLTTEYTLCTGLSITWLSLGRSITLFHTLSHDVVFVNNLYITLTQIMKSIVLARPDGWEVVTIHSNSFHIVIMLGVLSAMDSHWLFLSFSTC